MPGSGERKEERRGREVRDGFVCPPPLRPRRLTWVEQLALVAHAGAHGAGSATSAGLPRMGPAQPGSARHGPAPGERPAPGPPGNGAGSRAPGKRRKAARGAAGGGGEAAPQPASAQGRGKSWLPPQTSRSAAGAMRARCTTRGPSLLSPCKNSAGSYFR